MSASSSPPSSPFWSSSSPQSASPPGPASASAPRPTSGLTVALMIVACVVWLGVTVVADFLGFLMFAFADSPGAGRAAQIMIVPAFAWFAFTFIAGAVLLFFRRWWTIALAFVLAVSPPFVIFAGYNLLDGAGGTGGGGGMRSTAVAPTTAPAPVVRMPPGGFAPPPMKVREQPDFRKAFPVKPTTQPAAAATTQP